MKLNLLVLGPGKSAGTIIPIKRNQFTIGRDPRCNLRPASSRVSEKHCALLVKGERAFVKDLNSSFGTSINNEPVQGSRELKNEDVLKVGSLEFRVLMETTQTGVSGGNSTKGSESLNEDDVAAMMLSLEEEPGAPEDGEKTSDSEVDEMPKSEDEIKQEVQKSPESSSANTAQAAEAILGKLAGPGFSLKKKTR